MALRPGYVALRLLPRLAALTESRTQARWQFMAAAGEHQMAWQLVVAQLDTEIEKTESLVAQNLNMSRFRYKRGIKEQ